MQAPVVTETCQTNEEGEQLVLRLRAPVERPRVTWGAGVIGE